MIGEVKVLSKMFCVLFLPSCHQSYVCLRWNASHQSNIFKHKTSYVKSGLSKSNSKSGLSKPYLNLYPVNYPNSKQLQHSSIIIVYHSTVHVSSTSNIIKQQKCFVNITTTQHLLNTFCCCCNTVFHIII